MPQWVMDLECLLQVLRHARTTYYRDMHRSTLASPSVGLGVLALGRLALLACSALLLACSSPQPPVPGTDLGPPLAVTAAQVPERWAALQGSPALLLGELHDDPAHPPLQRALVQTLVTHGRLAALVLEMAEQGRSTLGLAADASEAEVQAALAWSDAAWPWPRYGPTVMAAVAAGVPVLGGNLPRSRLRAVMTEPAWDRLLDTAGLAEMGERIRQGHCGLLPESQIPGMVRIQVARDRAMAETLLGAWRAGATVLLLAGNEHVRTDLGVPRHLAQLPTPWPAAAAGVQAVQLRPLSDGERAGASHHGTVWPTPAQPPRDHCAALRRQLRQSGS